MPSIDSRRATREREETHQRFKMSLRRSDETNPASANPDVTREHIEQLRAAHAMAEAEAAASAAMQALAGKTIEEPALHASDFDRLNPVEKSAASLGVHPEAWKPISFMNTSHFSTLLKSNAVSGELAQGVEAFKEVSSVDV